jgi:hypothetical protein
MRFMTARVEAIWNGSVWINSGADWFRRFQQGKIDRFTLRGSTEN